MDQLRYDADPDSTFHFYANPYPDLTLSFTHVGKSNFLLLFTVAPVNVGLSFS